MVDIVVLNDEVDLGAADDKTKRERLVKVSSVSSAARRKLADISNLQQRATSCQDVKPEQSGSLSADEYVEKLLKDHTALLKVLAEKNKIIEMSGIELQKLRINVLKLQQQNVQLAQANSQMLADLNSGKDRLRVFAHELGCKNGLIKAKEVQLKEKAKREVLQTSNTEARKISSEADGSVEGDTDNENTCNTKRRWLSKTRTLEPSHEKPMGSKDKVDKKRLSARRQSARFCPQEPEPTEVVPEADDSKEKNDKKRHCVKRQLAGVKCQESGLREDEFDMDAKDVKKRLCERRQSARLRAPEQEAGEGFCELNTESILSSSTCGPTLNRSIPTSSGSFLPSDNDSGSEAQEMRRISVGRPLRRAAGKVQTYKEIPLNVKMRRSQ